MTIEPARRSILVQPRMDRLARKETGITGLDQITGGGLPIGRMIAVTGSPGSGKSNLVLQILAHRAIAYGEPGIFASFEESEQSIRQNTAGFRWATQAFETSNLHILELRGARLDGTSMITTITNLQTRTGARNIVVDGLDVLLANFGGEQSERQELARLSDWIAQHSLFAIVTMKIDGSNERERSRDTSLHYFSECVISLSSTLYGSRVSRALRVLKYRGSDFVPDAMPMAISRRGIEVMPPPPPRVTPGFGQMRLRTGVVGLDAVLDGGYIPGSVILVSGPPGTGKSCIASSFINDACLGGLRPLAYGFANVIQNMRSIGINLDKLAEAELVYLKSVRSPANPERQFFAIRGMIEKYKPEVLVIDPVSTLQAPGFPFGQLMLGNLFEFTRSRGITTLCTSLSEGGATGSDFEPDDVGSIADTWLRIERTKLNGEHVRLLNVVKSRGSAHSFRDHKLMMSPSGVSVVDVNVPSSPG